MDKQWKIRTAETYDMPAIYELEQTCFVSPWTAELLLLDICVYEGNHYFVMETDGKVIGFAGMNVVLDEAHVRKIRIAPQYRGQGYARKSLEHIQTRAMAEGAEGLTLEVRSSNTPAIRLYEKFGFITEGIRKKYYDNKEDALIMWKRELSGAQE